MNKMLPARIEIRIAVFLCFYTVLTSNILALTPPIPGYEKRIKCFIDSLHIVDTHEHFFEPETVRTTYFLDFTLMLHQNSWDDLISAGMPDSLYNYLFNMPISVADKWNYIEPYWKKSFNTSSNRVIMQAISGLYGFSEFNDTTVTQLSEKMKEVYGDEWFQYIMKDICHFDYVLQQNDSLRGGSDFVRYTEAFPEWTTIRSKFTLDSIAACQFEPVNTLDDLVNCQKRAFEKASERGIVAVKIDIAYERTLSIDDVSPATAKRVFRKLINSDGHSQMSFLDAKPLQDYMIHKLLELARQHNLPVAFHTGLQAGSGNYIENSDPSLLTNIFLNYPDVRFVLYHGSYPYGGKLSALAKNFSNVWLDMNWTYSLSPTYAGNYLKEWLDAVPASKIMAFGGDQRCVENTYGALMIAKHVIADVLTSKVKEGSLNENEAFEVAKMILHDNAVSFYNLE